MTKSALKSIKRIPSLSRLGGFTLLELLIVLSIVAIILNLASPGFQGLILEKQLNNHVTQFTTGIEAARNEMLNYPGLKAIMCSSTTLTSCSNNSDWKDGWVVFIDINKNDAYDNSIDKALLVNNESTHGLSIKTTGFPANSKIVFNDYGIPVSGGAITFCDNRGATSGKALVLSPVGNVRHAVDEDSDAIVNIGNGNNIQC